MMKEDLSPMVEEEWAKRTDGCTSDEDACRSRVTARGALPLHSVRSLQLFLSLPFCPPGVVWAVVVFGLVIYEIGIPSSAVVSSVADCRGKSVSPVVESLRLERVSRW